MPKPKPLSPKDFLPGFDVTDKLQGALLTAFTRGSEATPAITREALSSLGITVSSILRSETPVATGALRDSVRPLLRSPGSRGSSSYTGIWSLFILQDSRSSFPSRTWGLPMYRPFVYHGVRPASPPPVYPLAIWASAKFGVDLQRSFAIASSISRSIARRGVTPNPYVYRAFVRSIPYIRRTADSIGRSILGVVTDELPAGSGA